MKYEIHRWSYVDAFGSLLDIAADSGLEDMEILDIYEKCLEAYGGDIGSHFDAVGDYMREAMSAIEHAKGKAA